MSDEEIVSYARQRPVNWAFILTVTILALVSLWFRTTLDEIADMIFTFIGTPLLVMFIGLVFGVLSKRAIDYHPGEWQKEKIWLSFHDYEKVVETHRDAYGHLYGSDDSCGCCCTFLLLPTFGLLIIAFTYLSPPLFTPEIDALMFFLFLVVISATLGFLWGFKVPKIDKEEFFKPVMNDDEFIFVEALSGVTGLRVGVSAEIGTRGKSKMLLGAEPKIYVEGLPDTVVVSVKVSHSGFAYPYLVGTAYKGSKVNEEKISYNLPTRYPAIVEQSMDGEVAVFVARFEIPSRTSSVPSISKDDFRDLASLMIRLLKQNA